MPRDLFSLFNPTSIAVIGASHNPAKVGGIVVANILKSGFPGKVYPVNPDAGDIAGLPVFPDIAHVPLPLDLAVIALPAPLVNPTLEEIGKHGIKNVVIFTAGFKEIGSGGETLEQNLIATAARYNLNILGPNCLGFVNNLLPLNLTFGQQVKEPGNLRCLSQSGAIAASIFDWCQTTGFGFSDFVTIGNKSVLTENEILAYWQSNSYKALKNPRLEGASDNRPLGLYLESIADGRKFLELTSTISKTDPIFIVKPGKTKAAAKAMQSHTGAIAGEDSILNTALAQAGVTRCEGLEDFFDFAKAFSWENPPQGPNIAVVSNAGGPGVIIADAIGEAGLAIAQFDDQTRLQLSQHLPRTASFLNPVDVLGDALANEYAQAMETIINQPSVHAVIAILTPQVMTQIEKTAEAISQISRKYQKPIFCSFIGGSHIAKGEDILNHARIPSFRYPERAVRAVAAMWRWQQWRTTPQTPPPHSPGPIPPGTREILADARQHHLTNLSFLESDQLCQAAGISTPPSQTVKDTKSALEFAQAHQYPVVLKLSSPAIVHKTDVKGVIANIKNDADLETNFDAISQTKDALEKQLTTEIGISIQKQVADGLELIVGVKHDPTFGPVLLLGAGGLYAEVLSDHNLRLLPAGSQEITALIERSKVYPLLSGYRGRPPLAVDKLVELVSRLANLALDFTEISEIEINPVILTQDNAWAVDCRVILNSS